MLNVKQFSITLQEDNEAFNGFTWSDKEMILSNRMTGRIGPNTREQTDNKDISSMMATAQEDNETFGIGLSGSECTLINFLLHPHFTKIYGLACD